MASLDVVKHRARLSRRELLEACRDIYEAAGEDFILPPLIRTAAAGPAAHVFYSLSDTQCIRLTVGFDKAYVDENRFPLPRLPLRFVAELCDLDFEQTPTLLCDEDRAELIRAFFLGAQTPIFCERSPLAPAFSLRLKLSSAFFVECGELENSDDDPTLESICARIGGRLTEKCAGFLASDSDVWARRAAQELFGVDKPDADQLWPESSPETHETEEPHSIEPATISPTEIGYDSPARLAPPTAPGNRTASVWSAAAAVVAALGLAAATMIASPVEKPAAERKFGRLVEASFDLPPPLLQAAPDAVPLIDVRPPPPEPVYFTPPPPTQTPIPAKAENPPPRPKPAVSPSKAKFAVKEMKARNHHARGKESGPFTKVGRAADALAGGVVKTLTQLPGKMANLISGK